jgi:hypothetical protein
VLPAAIEKKLAATVELNLQKRMGLREGEPVGADVKALVMEEVKKHSDALLRSRIPAEVRSNLAALGHARTQERLRSNLGMAKDSITALAAANEVAEILKKRAELLAKKKAALETAGFSADQAMQIVLADIASKAH